LTSKTAEAVKLEFNGRTPVEQVLFYAGELIRFGFTDIVCSPEEAPFVKAKYGDKLVTQFDDQQIEISLDTPGIRLPGDSLDDQSRTDTPFWAIKNGADRLVIGRSLSKDGDLAGNYGRIMANIEGRKR
jgi:orotidine-5'-phosphate decarboxylase